MLKKGKGLRIKLLNGADTKTMTSPKENTAQDQTFLIGYDQKNLPVYVTEEELRNHKVTVGPRHQS